MPYVECAECGHGFHTRAGDAACPGCGQVHEVAARLPWRKRILPWCLVAALLPLLWSVFSGPNDVAERIERTAKENPREVTEETTLDELIGSFPGGRIEGALHPRGTGFHWLYAAISAFGFWLFLLVAYPMGRANSGHLWALGVFTGTIGILLLLAFQFVASQVNAIRGGGILFLIVLFIKLIGFSYSAALDPDTGFLASLAGFTFGVGLCEELCKALPLLWALRRGAQLDVRGAVVWGLATGIGFGVSEGVHYASAWYNGLSTGGIYVVRFVSCVALHAVWSAGAAILLLKYREEIEAPEGGWELLWSAFFPVVTALSISMGLHGLYDTLLKRDHDFLAFLTALASFVWFLWLCERAKRKEEAAALHAPAPAGVP